jgi:hypothetical protein
MLSFVERPILADQIRKVSQQSRFTEAERLMLESAFSALLESRQTQKLDCETRTVLTSIFERPDVQQMIV